MAPQSRGLKAKPAARRNVPLTEASIPLPIFPASHVIPSPDRTPTSLVPGSSTAQAAPNITGSSASSSSISLDQNDGHTYQSLEDDEEEEADADFESHYSLAASSASGSDLSSSGDDSDEDTESKTQLLGGSKNKHNGQIGSSTGLNALHAHAHGSGTNLTFTNSFAPPFYNRPPTPLPPSPSLTSLLRPPFSTTTSRPTTPDSSEVETPPDTEATVAKSARTATTVPRASPKVPTYEYYGFGVYLASSGAFIMYLLWSYLPSPFLHQFGIYYYPNRWWSLAIPSFLVMLIIYIYVALASYNTGYLTLPMNSIENLVDDAANIAAVDDEGHIQKRPTGLGEEAEDTMKKHWRDGWEDVWNTGIDAVMDIPIGAVCEVLYGDLVENASNAEVTVT